MSDDQTSETNLDEAPGWRVIDADGNVVDSGPVVQLEAAGNPDDDEEQR